MSKLPNYMLDCILFATLELYGSRKKLAIRKENILHRCTLMKNSVRSTTSSGHTARFSTHPYDLCRMILSIQKSTDVYEAVFSLGALIKSSLPSFQGQF